MLCFRLLGGADRTPVAQIVYLLWPQRTPWVGRLNRTLLLNKRRLNRRRRSPVDEGTGLFGRPWRWPLGLRRDWLRAHRHGLCHRPVRRNLRDGGWPGTERWSDDLRLTLLRKARAVDRLRHRLPGWTVDRDRSTWSGDRGARCTRALKALPGYEYGANLHRWNGASRGPGRRDRICRSDQGMGKDGRAA